MDQQIKQNCFFYVLESDLNIGANSLGPFVS